MNHAREERHHRREDHPGQSLGSAGMGGSAGKTVSQLIDEEIIQKAVRPLREAAAVAEAGVGDDLLRVASDG
jgi:hypothetical protein